VTNKKVAQQSIYYNKLHNVQIKSILANRPRNDGTLGARTALSGRLFLAYTTLLEKTYLLAQSNDTVR